MDLREIFTLMPLDLHAFLRQHPWIFDWSCGNTGSED